MGNVAQYQPIIVVYCEQEQQIERMLNRGLTREEAMFRIASQMSTKYKLMFADFAIDTSSSKEESINQTEIIISCLQKYY